VGRTIFADAARAWFAGQTGDEAAISDMAGRFESLTETWRRLGETQAA
jgi:5-dehydro-2-deoxygluconokinase